MNEPTSEPPHVTRIRIRYGETDQMGVVYHPEYLVFCEVGRTELIRSLGMSYASMESAGVYLAVTEATLRYHAPARYDDLILVETRLIDVTSRGVQFSYVIRHADSGARLVSATTRLVATGREGKPQRMPDDIRAMLEGGRKLDSA